MAEQWRLAHALRTLFKQINKAFPSRSKIHDGTIGDEAHSTRKSDHNPHNGIVHAADITHDPKNGIDCNILAEALIRSRDARISYVIWNKQIFSATVKPWEWRPYTGANGHTKHLHISVTHARADDDAFWRI